MGSGTIALRGQHGVIGFVPKKAVDVATNDVSLAVVFTFQSGKDRTVNVRVSRAQLQHQAGRHKGPGGAAELRTWIADRARQELHRTQPGLTNAAIEKAAVFWACGNPARLEPFLR